MLLSIFKSKVISRQFVPFLKQQLIFLTTSMSISENKLTLIARGSGSSLFTYGSGSSCVVLKAVSSSDRREQSHLRNQFSFLREVQHQHIVRALRYQERVALGNTKDKQFDTKNIIVLEHAQHGSLLNYIQKHRDLSINQKKVIFRDIVDAVDYLHRNGIAHRDLKLENVLVFSEQEEGEGDGEICVKISDFGFASKFLLEGERLTFLEYKGTRKGYMAPEIHHCHQNKDKPYQADKTDIFALGVILFALVVGNLPFELAAQENKLYKMIIDKQYEEFWKCHLQVKKMEQLEGFRVQEFKELFQKMVSSDPKERPSAKEVLKSSWII